MTSTEPADRVIVWGNCQAAPLADLLRDPLAGAGLHVVEVPAVHLATPEDIEALRPTLPRCAAFVTQPVREAAYGGGRGSDTLITQLPPSCVVLHYPNTYDTSPFPFQVDGHDGDGVRADAPLTDYHDLRISLAATRGLTVEQTLTWWPDAPAAAIRAHADASRAELRRREQELDIASSDLLDLPDAMWTMTHPSNRTLASVATRILDALRERGVPVDAATKAPDREYLAERRTPLEDAVAEALDWPADTVHSRWIIRGEEVDPAELVAAHLKFYAERPDVAADNVDRNADRLALFEVDR